MLLMDKPTEVLQERVNGIFRGCRETESRHFFFFSRRNISYFLPSIATLKDVCLYL